MTHSSKAAPPPARPARLRLVVTQHAKLTLVAACLSGALFQLDLTALSAALPDIARSLHAQTTDQAWVIDIYSLALIVTLPLAGPIADRHGRRRVFVGGAALFAVASILCATAATFSSLLAWRALQGVAGAALTSSAAALLAAAFPDGRRAWAFGLLGTVIGASMVAGPPVGVLIAALAGWKWIFWINLPVCGLLILLTPKTDHDRKAAPQAPLDWAGPIALAIGVGALACLLLGGAILSPYKAGLVCLSVLAAPVFIVVERRHPAPAFDFALFGSSRFLAMCLVPIGALVGYWALLVHLPQMARGPMGLDPAMAGVLLTALTAPMFLLPGLGARLAALFPAAWYFGGGLAALAASDVLLALAARDLGTADAVWGITAVLLLSGSACALFNAQITAAAVSAVPPDRAATASAMCVTMRQIGFTIGIALIGGMLKEGEGNRYPVAFGAVAGSTMLLAATVFALLRQSRSRL